jgi:hypothetical protein
MLRRILGIRRSLTVSLTALGAVLATAIPAVAHEAVLLDESDVNPYVAPLALDGTDAINFFGVLPKRHAVRSAQFNMQAGQQVNLSLIVTDLAPENTLATRDLPVVYLFSPNGTLTYLTPTMRVPFTAGGGFNLLRLLSHTAVATSGTYSIVVTGRAPARFIVGIGADEEGSVFDGIERATLATEEQLLNWYNTAP